ncbi:MULTISPECIES: transporter substrate-binding domain-containing protein [unclassified Pseudoalteromonas]|uniref:substrate-binding periplasmic protein n=1 Tax=unclassified Pseudoalteromonas TaxID=194690 RepID=UPI001F3C7B30|nr:transporter substrate-binding domain-containing protein [Pseudoalteromonas sp. L1]WOC25214.1 transporter substrate-binding domain-containing protein [Pseudoalteromonas sp. N1230-9]
MIVRLTCLFCCLMLSFSLNSQTWRLVTEPFPPFLIDNNEKPGWVHELVVSALKSQNKNVEIEYTHWARALKLAQRHKRVAVIGAFYTLKRAKIFTYSRPIATADIVLLKRADSEITYSGSLYSLTPYTISKGEDYVISEEFEHHPQLAVTTTHSLIESLTLLIHGRVDLVAGTKEVALYWLENNETLQNLKHSEIKVITPFLSTQKLHVITAKNHPQSAYFQQDLYTGLQTIVANGDAAKILKRYDFDTNQTDKVLALLSKNFN